MDWMGKWLWENYQWIQHIPVIAKIARWLIMKTGMKYAMIVRNRQDLMQFFPLSQAIRRGDKIYALWLSGLGVLDNMPLKERESIKQITFPSPDCPSLGDLEHYIDTAKGYIFTDMKQKIISATKISQAAGTQVKYWHNFPGMSLTFGDPTERNGWLQIELLLPRVEPGERTVFRIEKKDNNELFLEYWEIYGRIWEKSSPPPIL